MRAGSRRHEGRRCQRGVSGGCLQSDGGEGFAIFVLTETNFKFVLGGRGRDGGRGELLLRGWFKPESGGGGGRG